MPEFSDFRCPTHCGGGIDLLSTSVAIPGSRFAEKSVTLSTTVTGLLRDWRSGDDDALERLTPLVYQELRRIAAQQMARERPGHTLQATALVNEAFLRMADADIPWQDRVHFFAVAARTMRGFGGLVTFMIKDADWEATARIVDAIRLARIAPSLGGVESLIEQPMIMSYNMFSPEERQQFGITDNMVRLSCGVEDTDDLIADLEQALA